MIYKAVYKCRLCGKAYQDGTNSDTKEFAEACMTQICCEMRGMPMAPNEKGVHRCGGAYEGGLGLADFCGLVAEED